MRWGDRGLAQLGSAVEDLEACCVCPGAPRAKHLDAPSLHLQQRGWALGAGPWGQTPVTLLHHPAQEGSALGWTPLRDVLAG